MKKSLALNGAPPSVRSAIPPRLQFGPDELDAIKKVFDYSYENQKDIGYQDEFEKRYTDKFCEYLGGGFADAVSSGTAALMVAIAALNLKPEDEIVFPPVTDPGGITPAIFLKYPIRIADSEINTHHIGLKELLATITPKTKAVVVVHVSGVPLEIDVFAKEMKERGIFLIEDCSQAHGATYKGKMVGTFGDISMFSTMFSKNHSSGSCGGIVYSTNEKMYESARVVGDRGKPFYLKDFRPKEPSTFLRAGLNFHQSEFACAIGISTLGKLPQVIKRRTEILEKISAAVSGTSVYAPLRIPAGASISPFFMSIRLILENIKVSKKEFCDALIAEGIPINPRYDYVVADWPWMREYLPKDNATPNASKFRDESFNILFHEKFREENVNEIIEGLLKVGEAYRKTPPLSHVPLASTL